MSLSNTYIKASPILLDQFMQWAGIHPLAFHDIDVSTCIPNLALSYVQCQQFNQFNWQGSGISIELLSEKLNEAYLMIEQLLPFSLQPDFVEDTVEIPKFFRSYLTPNGYLTYDTLLQTNKKCIKAFGQRKTSKLSTVGTIVYTDDDNDGFKETATITFTLEPNTVFSSLDATMVYVTHAAQNGNKKYKIPVTLVSYTETEVIMKGYAWDFLDESIVLNTSFTKNRSIDGCNESFYIEDAELWYETVDSTKPHGYIECSDSSDNIPFQVDIVDSDNGLFRIKPGTVDELGVFTEGCGFSTGCSKSKHIKVFYVSHCGNVNTGTFGLSICPTLLISVFKLACCLLPIELCADCSNLKSVVEYYQTDLAYKVSGRGESMGFAYSYETFMQTWNRSCRGAVEAFREVYEFQNSKCARIETISNMNI